MLSVIKGNTADHLVLTLSEMQSIPGANYLVVCQHITTKEFVRFVLLASSDISGFKTRFNEFVINTSLVFSTASLGQYLYKVYEQVSATNTDETGLNLIENGKLNFLTNSAFAYQKYEPPTNYQAYGG